MPHIIIEHSTNIFEKESLEIGREIQKIMSSISEGNFDPDHCKIRAIAYQNYIVGLEKITKILFIFRLKFYRAGML